MMAASPNREIGEKTEDSWQIGWYEAMKREAVEVQRWVSGLRDAYLKS